MGDDSRGREGWYKRLSRCSLLLLSRCKSADIIDEEPEGETELPYSLQLHHLREAMSGEIISACHRLTSRNRDSLWEAPRAWIYEGSAYRLRLKLERDPDGQESASDPEADRSRVDTTDVIVPSEVHVVFEERWNPSNYDVDICAQYNPQYPNDAAVSEVFGLVTNLLRYSYDNVWERRSSSLLLCGASGSGKTSLCRYIADKYYLTLVRVRAGEVAARAYFMFYLSIHLSIYLSIYLSINQSINSYISIHKFMFGPTYIHS